MANVPATIDPARPSWLSKYVPADAALANAEYAVPTGIPIGVISIKGKVWAARYQGVTTKLLLDGYPVPYFDAVIVGANLANSKTFYLGAFEEGSAAPPDCASDDGITPLPNVPHKQHPVCEGCPHNKFRPDGAPGHKGKRCQDNKRIAVLPDGDMANEAFGGPMLLRLAPSSRSMFGEYLEEQSAAGRPLHAIVTRMSFDSDQAGVTINFKFNRWLDEEEEVAQVVKWRNDDFICRVLGTEHPPEWKPSATQGSEAGQANGKTNGNGHDLAAAVDVAEAAVTKPVVKLKPIEPVKPAEPPKLTADEKKAARIAAVKAEMERELAAKMAAMDTDEEGEDEGGDDEEEEVTPIDDTKSVMDMLDKFAAQE